MQVATRQGRIWCEHCKVDGATGCAHIVTKLRERLAAAESVILSATHMAEAHRMLTSERTKRATLENFSAEVEKYDALVKAMAG